MVDLSSLLTDEDLRRRYGTPTLDRAWDYVRRGQVLSCVHDLDSDGDLDIRGTVAGSTSAPYTVNLSVGSDGEGVWVFGRCSCPVHEGCKHSLALLITVRDEHARTSPSHGRRWERQLSSLLDELDERADRGSRRAQRPLALQVDLRAPTRSTGFRGWAQAEAPAARGTLRVRPLQRGARDNWVRTGISWTDVPALDRRGHPADQVTVLNDLLSAHRAATRQMYFGSDAHLSLGTFGPDEALLLRRAVDAGMPLVAGPGLAHVEVADPVTLRLDVNAAPEQDARLRLGVRLEEEWYGASDLDVLGEGGHAVALWLAEGDAWAVTLAGLTAPVGPEVRRLLKRGDSVVVPAADREDLIGDYLPRLHRHVPVISSDGSVAVPETAEPRLVLAVTWVAADEVAVAWTWRYRVGGDDRVYRLSETRGLRGVRRPEDEQALLDALVLDDEQVYHLCRGRQRDLGLEDGGTFRDAHAVLFAEQLLPGLRGRVEIEEIGDQPHYQEIDGTPVVHFATREAAGDDPTRTDWLDLEVEVTVDGTPISLAHVLEALTKGMDRVVLRSGRHLRIDRPEFAHLARLVEAAAELRDQPDGAVRVGHHDLGLWDELAEVGIVDAAGRPVGPLGAGAPHAGHAARGGPGRGDRRAALLPARRLPLAGLPVAVRARRDPRRRHGARQDAGDPGAGRARPRARGGAVPGGRADQRGAGVGGGGRGVHPRPRRAGGDGVPGPARAVARLALRGRRRGGHLLHPVPARAGRLRHPDLGRAGARRGADRQEPPGQDPPGRAAARRTVPAGAVRDADGEPADGALVPAVDRGAGAVPVAAALPGDGGQPGRAAR